MKCYKHIHFFGMRMGCISTEEFFYILLKYIKVFCNENDDTVSAGNMEERRCHIVIDDLQMIEYSFPFLKGTPLFLTTLITLCHQHRVELKILCNKKSSLVNELCALADNVICVSREKDSPEQIRLFLEHHVNTTLPNKIYEYTVRNVKSMYQDSCIGFNQDTNPFNMENIDSREIGSMKDFWRKAIDLRR